jgi:hypothetical protein
MLTAAFALLFAHAALGKWSALGEFSAVLGNYRLLPAPLVGALGVLVPTVEAAVALLLLAAPTRAWAAAAGGALLFAYAIAIAINLRRGRIDLDCGCAGPGHRRSIARWMVWRNLLLVIALAVTGPPWSPRVLDTTDLITVGGGLAVIALLYGSVDRLLGQVMPRAVALRGRP